MSAEPDLWEIGNYGTDREWFEATGNCGGCGLSGASCDCTDTDPCECGDLHGKGKDR